MNQNQLLKLNQVATDPTNFIFKALAQLTVPWSTDSTLLDIEYLGRSGNKITAPLLDNIIKTNQDTKLTADQVTLLAKIIHAKFNNNWNKLYATTTVEYNPVNNYDMVETETTTDSSTSDTTATSTTNNTSTTDIIDHIVDSGTQESTDTSSKNNTTKTSGSDNTSKFGFNTASAVPTDSTNAQTTQESTDTSTDTNKQSNSSQSDTTTNNTSSADTKNTSTDNNKTNHDIQRKLTRSGNIGVTTTQQMLESERQLNMWIFFEHVYQDIDSVLTISTYGGVLDEWI